MPISIKSNFSYGIYEVGTRQFVNKTEALYYATKNNATPHWNFHDKTYSKFDWTVRPTGTLQEIYRRRAQQIRDSYDYVVVYFGGGADSWTALHSFLSNGIHVDEIFTRWAFVEEKFNKVDDLSTHQRNLHSEFKYATLPVLKEIEKKYPKTKIVIDDYSEAYNNDVNESTLNLGGHYLTLGTFHRFTRRSPLEIQARDENKTIGIVQGFDKTGFIEQDGETYGYFIDRFAGTDNDDDRSIEPFFWTKNMPEIPIMQAHELKRYHEMHPKLPIYSMRGHMDRETYCRVCYPDWNRDTFQVGKPLGSEIWASEAWVQQYNPRYFDSWKWALNQYMPAIDPTFFEYRQNETLRVGYTMFKSNLYHLGKFSPIDH
jgi:hypothetical protein